MSCNFVNTECQLTAILPKKYIA